jgi:hypothetical protein
LEIFFFISGSFQILVQFKADKRLKDFVLKESEPERKEKEQAANTKQHLEVAITVTEANLLGDA